MGWWGGRSEMSLGAHFDDILLNYAHALEVISEDFG